MSVAGRQTLQVLYGSYVLDRPAERTDVDLRADVLVCRRHGCVSGSDMERRPGAGFLTVTFGLEIDELDRDNTGGDPGVRRPGQ